MCDASFIPLELIKDLLKDHRRELNQEDYAKIKKQIEDDETIQDLVGTKEALNRPIPQHRDKKTFQERLVAYANEQIKYSKNDVIDLLQGKVNGFLSHDNTVVNPAKKIEDHLQTIEGYLAGYCATWILDIGLKSGLFAAIAEAATAISVDELSWKLGLTPFYVGVWCKAAYSFAFLDVPGGSTGYRLAPGIQALLLDTTQPASMRFDIAFSTMLHQDFLHFPEYMKTGEKWPLADRPMELHKLYVEATLDDYPVLTDVILPFMIGEDEVYRLKSMDNYTVLDVGTGAGFALVHYARFFDKANIIGIDINPSRVVEARHTIQAAVTDPTLKNHKIEVRHQDVNALEDQEVYDLVVINLVLYQIPSSEYANVFQRLYSALKPGGVMVIAEYHFPNLAPERTYRYPGYQSFLSYLLHFALTGATMVSPENLIADFIKPLDFEVICGKAIHHPLEERQVIVAKKTEENKAGYAAGAS